MPLWATDRRPPRAAVIRQHGGEPQPRNNSSYIGPDRTSRFPSPQAPMPTNQRPIRKPVPTPANPATMQGASLSRTATPAPTSSMPRSDGRKGFGFLTSLKSSKNPRPVEQKVYGKSMQTVANFAGVNYNGISIPAIVYHCCAYLIMMSM